MFGEKLTELKNECRDVFFRLNEKKLRPRKLDELKDVLNKSVDFLASTKNLTGEDLPLTEVERTTLEKLVNSTKEWRVKMLNEQAKVADNEAPKLLSADITDKIDALKREVNYMVTKIKYFKPKVKKPAADKNKNATNTTETNGDGEKKQEEEQSGDGAQDQEKPMEEDFFDQTTPSEEDTTTSTGKFE